MGVGERRDGVREEGRERCKYSEHVYVGIATAESERDFSVCERSKNGCSSNSIFIKTHLLGLLERLRPCFGDDVGEGRGEEEGEEPNLDDLSPPNFGLPCCAPPRPLFGRSIATALGLLDLSEGDRSIY